MMKELQEYGSCVLFNLVIPLLPILLEKWFTSEITSPSLMISAAIFAISVGNASTYKLLFSLSIAICIIFSACFGVAMADNTHTILPANSHQLAGLSIMAIMIASLAEKYAVYVVDKKKCFNF